MIFSSEFLTLDLNEKNKTTNNSVLDVFISRKNNNYYNREGIEIYVSEYLDGKWINRTLNAILYTEFNPFNISVPSNPKNVIADFYRFEKTFQIDNVNLINNKRIGSKQIKVELIESKNKTVILIGEIELNTLEIPLPKINMFQVTNEGKSIRLKFQGINPRGDYRLKINASYLIEPIVNLLPITTLNTLLPITENLYRQQVLFEAEWYLGTILIERQKIVFKVPSFDLGLKFKTNNTFLDLENIYIKINNSFVKAEKVYQKIGGEYLSQE